MNLKKIYKNINVFQKKINSKKVIFGLFTALTIFTAIDFVSDKNEFIEVVEYKPFEEQAKFENNFQNNITFDVYIDKKEKFYLDSFYFSENQELFFLLEDKLKELNTIVNNKKEKFVNSPLLLSYGEHVEERENEVLKTKIFKDQQKQLFIESKFSKFNNEYIISDKRGNISQFEISDVNLVNDFLDIKVEQSKNLEELLDPEKSTKKENIYNNYKLGVTYKDEKVIINKNDEYLSITFLNNEYDIYKIAILNNNGNIFYADKEDAFSYSKLIFEDYKNLYIENNYDYSDFFNIYLSNIFISILIFLVLNLLLKIYLFSLLIKFKKSLSNDNTKNSSFKINYNFLVISISFLTIALSTTFSINKTVLFDWKLSPYYNENKIEYKDPFIHLSNYYKSVDLSKFKNISKEEIFDKKNEKIYDKVLYELYYFNQLEDYVMLKNNNDLIFREKDKENPFFYKFKYTNENLNALYKENSNQYLNYNSTNYLINSNELSDKYYSNKWIDFIPTNNVGVYNYSIQNNIIEYNEKNPVFLNNEKYIKYMKNEEAFSYTLIEYFIKMMFSTSSLYLYFLFIYIGLHSNKRFIKFIKRRKKYKVKNNLISIEKKNNIEIKEIIKINK